MSFALTIQAYEARTKDVTRRLGWAFLQPGDEVMGVVKCQGLKRGEKVQKLHAFRTAKVTREYLQDIKLYGPEEIAREGFPEMTADEFVEMFCSHNRCDKVTRVTRIEFEHLPLK